jgi:hypothetical protein
MQPFVSPRRGACDVSTCRGRSSKGTIASIFNLGAFTTMSQWTVREYLKSDWALVSTWWDAHAHGSALGEALLPPTGIVVEHEGEPLCACWLYLAVNIGVCWLEYPVSKPGLKLHEAREAFHLAIQALEKIARALDYRIMLAHTLPGIARVMRSFGFHAESRRKVSVSKHLG